MVLWPFILYAEKNPHEAVRNHEAIHLDQIKRVGVMRFYTRYLAEYARGRWQGLDHNEAYLNISFEREAYLNQNDKNYLAKN